MAAEPPVRRSNNAAARRLGNRALGHAAASPIGELQSQGTTRSLSENAISEKTTTTYSTDPLKWTIYVVVVRILDYEFSDSLLGT
jgi:hypothetical protein